MNTDRAKVEELTITLTDQIATLEQKYKHKEVEYDEYEKLSQFYEKQHADKVMQLLQEARINELEAIPQFEVNDVPGNAVRHILDRIKQLKEPSK